MLEIDPLRLQKLLKWTGLAKQTKPTIDPIVLELQENYGLIRQLDSTETVAVILRLDKSYFTSYATGKLVFPVADLLKILQKVFKTEKTVKISVDEKESKLVIEGTKEKLKILMPGEAEVKSLKSNLEFIDPVGLVPSELKPAVGYLVDLDELRATGADKIKFNYGESVTLVIDETTMTYERKLSYSNRYGSGEGTVTIDGSIFDKISKIMTGPGWLLFTKEGPMMVAQNTKEYNLTYILTPMVE